MFVPKTDADQLCEVNCTIQFKYGFLRILQILIVISSRFRKRKVSDLEGFSEDWRRDRAVFVSVMNVVCYSKPFSVLSPAQT